MLRHEETPYGRKSRPYYYMRWHLEINKSYPEQMLAHSKDVYYPARITIGSIEPLGTTPSKANNELSPYHFIGGPR